MQIGFYCPDGEKILHEDCFKKCRMRRRCLTLPTLMKIGYKKEWSGRVSTTECLRGTMELFLRYTHDYYVKPKWFAFMLLGTSHHSLLEESAKKKVAESLSEERFERESDADNTGIADLLEPDEEDPNSYVLTDYKTWGSYSLAKALGICKGEVPDPEGVPYKSGPRKGQPRMMDVIDIDPSKADNLDTELQMNKYRIKFERAGFPVSRLQVQATVRDGNTRIARDRGVMDTMYLIEINKMPDKDVEDYFLRKTLAIQKAMKDGEWHEVCTERERWEGMKCEGDGYCPVREHCPQYKQNRG
jgi:hypothetical protein